MANKNSLQKKLRNLMIGIVVILIVSTGLFFHEFAKHEINQKYKNEAFGVIDYTILLLSKTIEDAEMGIYAVENRIKDQSEIASFLNLIYETTANTSTIFIGDDAGRFYRYPERFVSEDYDPRTRSWYENSLKVQESIVWSTPYIDHGTGELTITGSKRIHLAESINGVVGADLLLSEMSGLIESISVGKNGYVFVVSSDGTIIAHRDLDALGQNIELLEWTQNQSNKTIYTSPFEKTGFQIVAVVDHKDVKENLVVSNTITIGLFLIFIILANYVASHYTKKIIRPMNQLVGVMENVESGNYNLKCDATSDDEVGLLIDGFNNMIESINENSIEMQALYEELYASEETLQSQYDTLLENTEFIKKSEARYKAIFEASKEGLWDTDENWVFSYLTPKWYEQFDIDCENTTFSTWMALVHPEDREMVKKVVDNHINKKTDGYRCEYRVLSKANGYRWIEGIGKARYSENGNFIGMSGSHSDITVRKRYEKKMMDMAYRDELTKLYNRSYFEEYLTDYLKQDGKGTIIFTDIDNFKHINDIYGHSFGDEVLVEVSNRIKKLFEDESKYLVARFSGDEFIVLLKNETDKPSIQFVLNAMIKEIQSTIHHGNKYFKISSSIGITIFPEDGVSVDALLQNADIAMYHAKRVSKKIYRYFDDDLKNNALLEMQIENHLKNAIDNDEIRVFFQPIMSMHTNKVSSFEALIRWESEKLGMVFPDVFIPVAEKTGLINELGMIVLAKSCAFIKKINQINRSNFKISVNISVVQLMEDHFANRVLNEIKRHGISNDQIILEITESMTLESNENIIAKLFYLKNHQIGIALDDFGTGYSSFRNLIGLPLSSIKMDKSIVHESIYNEHVAKLLGSIVDFAHKSNIDVVAEGIENEAYLDISKKLNVDFVQGYFFSKPMPEEEMSLVINRLSQYGVDENS